MGEKIRSRDERIERLHMVDLDVVVHANEDLNDVCDELVVGLLIHHSQLIPSIVETVDGTKIKINEWPIVRFTGPRSQLEELLNRYDGVTGAFDPLRNPDRQS